MTSNRAQVVDLPTGALISTFQHQDGVTAVAFSPQSNRAASAAQGGAVWIWNPQTGQPLAGPCLHENTVFGMAFDAKGARLLTASADNTARIWNASTGAMLLEPLRHEDNVIAARFSPDGLRIATASDDSTTRLWDAQTGDPLCDPFRFEGRIEDIEFSPDSRLLAIASGHEIELWEIPSVIIVPPWLADLAEAVARLRRTGTTQFDVLPPENLIALRDQLAASTDTDSTTRWTKWFLADRSTRDRSP
jgi:YD repeat-containing protein